MGVISWILLASLVIVCVGSYFAILGAYNKYYGFKAAYESSREELTNIKDRDVEQQVRIRELEQINLENMVEIQKIKIAVEKEIENSKKIASQKKSSEVKLGQMSEQLLPFLEGFPFNPKDCKFLGMPIDMINFDFDNNKITFVEIKTGASKESSRQKAIKSIIKSGEVHYATIRLNEKGLTVTHLDK